MSKTKIALVGVGKIARDAHVPTIAESGAFSLAAAVTRYDPPRGVPAFKTITEMKAAVPEVAAVSICTPPRGRLETVREALEHGLDVMIEKPPAATVGEARALVDLSVRAGQVLYVSWHSRAAAAVEPAKAWLAGKTIRAVRVTWKEDVRVWHPGQAWIWEPGIGVFDPGINALSVITDILPGLLRVDEAELRFPANKAAPIAADLRLVGGRGFAVDIAFDFDQRGPQTWDIEVNSDEGALKLTHGASRMTIDGRPVAVGEIPEYRRLYQLFAELLARRESDADLTPFELVADAFLLGRRTSTSPFEDF